MILLVNVIFSCPIRDRSLTTGTGATNWEVGQVKFYPYKKGGGTGKVLAMLKGERKKFDPILRGMQKDLDHAFPNFVAQLPVINERSQSGLSQS